MPRALSAHIKTNLELTQNTKGYRTMSIRKFCMGISIPLMFFLTAFRWEEDAFGEVPPKDKTASGTIIAGQQVTDAGTLAAWKDVREKASEYKRRTPRIYVFSRAQLKYGLERDDYIHKWVDRPLYTDPSLSNGGGNFIKINSFRKMHDIIQSYGIDGFAFFPETKGRSELFDVCKIPGLEMTIMPEFAGPDKVEQKLEIAKAALENPNTFRINGKVVLTSYLPAPVKDWAKIKEELQKKYGDKFLIIPSNSFYPPNFKASGTDGQLNAKDIRIIQEYLREYLRVVDGFYYNSVVMRNRRYAADVVNDILVTIVKSVLAEPEFQNKFLGWGSKVGHENFERLGYSMDCTGTKFLRDTMETGIFADGDFINGIEWDEQNENTSFRPTVCNSLSTMRIMRYYTEKIKGHKISALPTDNLTVPNIILSYRKILVAGQKLEFEILNVPDSDKAGIYAIKLRLKNISGQVVHEFDEQTLNCNKLEDAFPSVPVEKLLAHQVLIPELEINGPQGKYIQKTGFHPIELRASWNWDFKWVKHPLRDILNPQNADMSIAKSKNFEGMYQLKVSCAAEEKLAYVDVMDCGDVVYSHQKNFSWRENERDVVIYINWQSLPYRIFKINGSIELTGTKGNWLVLNPKINRDRQKLSFKDTESSHYIQQAWVAVKREDLKNASFKIELPGIYQGELKVSDIITKDVMAFPAEQGFNLVFQRYCSQTNIPMHLDNNAAEFDILVKPSSSTAVLYLQMVSKSGKVYRGNAISLLQKTGQNIPLTVYSESEEKAVKVQVDSNQITKIDYKFNPEHGSALLCRENNQGLWGIAGGFRPQVVGRDSGESGYGCPLPLPLHNTDAIPEPPEKLCVTAPSWEKIADKGWVLKFSDYTYVSLPQMLVPAYSSFVLNMDVFPAENKGSQPLLDAKTTAFTLSIKNGMLEGTYYQNQKLLNPADKPFLLCKTGLQVPEKQWSNVKVYFDQQNLVFEVNGKRSQPFPCSGYNRYTIMYSLGNNSDKSFFKGMITNLSIEHKAPSQ
jgi:hypothetical protein